MRSPRIDHQRIDFEETAGELSGQFTVLNKGNLVRRIDGRKVFITYTAGDSNDVALFSAVPEL